MPRDIDHAVKAARRAFESGPWPDLSPSERGRLLWKLSDLLEKHREEFAELETLDNGKPLFFSRIVDIPTAVDVLRYMAGWATKVEGTNDSYFGARREIPCLQSARACGSGGSDHPVRISP